MPGTMTNKQFVNKPPVKTAKDYYYLPEYVEKRQSKAYKHIATYTCECGVKTISIKNHLQSIRHVNGMMKRDKDFVINL